MRVWLGRPAREVHAQDARATNGLPYSLMLSSDLSFQLVRVRTNP